MTTAKKPTTDAQTLMDLVLWARANKLLVSELTVGDIHIHYADLAVATGVPNGEERGTKESIYERYGKALLDSAEVDQATLDGTEDGPDDGEDVVVG